MYFPYLRGRQFELLALRELANQKLLGEHIIPIIEPVKLSSTLVNTLDVFVKTTSLLRLFLILWSEILALNLNIFQIKKENLYINHVS